MKVGILGPAGFSASYCAVELLNRGHQVVGISRNPERLGRHERYTAVAMAVEQVPVEELITTFKDLDVLINAYNPPYGPGVYSGTGFLTLPGKPHRTVADTRPAWLAYRRNVADSEAATAHLQERMGPGVMADGARAYRNARLALKAGRMTEEQERTIIEAEEPVLSGPEPVPELPSAARAAFMMFEGNTSFRWSFVSPPARFRPGLRTGTYELWVDELPLAREEDAQGKSHDGNEFECRMLGVSAADLAVAIVDQAEKGWMEGRHWSPTSEWEGDEVWPTHLTV